MRWILLFMLVLFAGSASAQDIPNIISAGISTVIRAVDLSIQRIQTKTIVLQEAEQTLENVMSSSLLDEIRDWVDQQRNLYSEYFDELAQVKSVIANYHRVGEAIQRQQAILQLYQQGIRQMGSDGHFSLTEFGHIQSVYSNLLGESENNLNELLKAVGVGAFTMTDEERLSAIDRSADGIDRNYQALQSFTQENELLSLRRARDENDYLTILKLYGL